MSDEPAKTALFWTPTSYRAAADPTKKEVWLDYGPLPAKEGYAQHVVPVIRLTPTEARDMARRLLAAADEVEVAPKG